MLQDRGGDIVREYKATHEDNFLEGGCGRHKREKGGRPCMKKSSLREDVEGMEERRESGHA